jgi:hypothetical protein
VALPTRLGNAGEGWHGDLAVALKHSIGSMVLLGNAEKASINDLLDKLDTDTGVTDTNYSSTLTIAATDVGLANRLEAGNGGALWGGDAGIISRQTLIDLINILNEARISFNDLLDKLDADVLVNDTNYSSTLTLASAAVSAVNAEAMNGGRSLHTDEGVALRTILLNVIALANEVKAAQNDLLTKLDADTGVAATNYLSTLEVDLDDAA